MTRTEMLQEIDALRAKGHIVGILGSVGAWTCSIDDLTGAGTTPVEAYQTAKECLVAVEAARS